MYYVGLGVGVGVVEVVGAEGKKIFVVGPG